MQILISWKKVAIIIFFSSFVALKCGGSEFQNTTDMGYEALANGDWKAAIGHFNDAIEVDPKNSEAYRGRGLAYGMKGDFDFAVSDFTKAIELDSKSATAYQSRGGYYLSKGYFDDAIADCSKAISLDPKDSYSYNNRGYAYLCKGRLENAISDFTEAIRIDPNYALSFANRGFARYLKYDYDDALADLNGSINIKATADKLQIRAAIYYCLGKFDKAISDLDKSITLNPRSVEAYRQRGSIHYLNKKYEQAIEDFTNAIQLDPQLPDAYSGRASCFAQLKDFDKAIRDLNAAIENNPNSPQLFEGRGALWILCNNYEKGIADFQTAIRLNPSDLASKFESWTKEPLTHDLIEHGEKQVSKLLKDRPVMGQYGNKAKVLYQWASRKFAGEDLGQKIYWDSSEIHPQFNSKSWIMNSSEISEGYISVREKNIEGPNIGKERDYEELWRDTVFELYNVANSRISYRLNKEAADGKILRNEYVVKKIEYELNAAEKTRAFYLCIFLDWANSQHFDTHPELWFVAQKSNPHENYLQNCISRNMPYWHNYENQYDLITLYSLIERGELEKARDLVDKITPQLATKEERAAIGLPKGYCLLRLKEALLAIDALDEYINFYPNDATAFATRAEAYKMLHDIDRAIADYSRAIQIEPHNSALFRGRGNAYEIIGDKEHAETDFTKVNELIENKLNKPSVGSQNPDATKNESQK